MTPLAANKALDAYFLEARARILDVAAMLDRIGRGRDAAPAAADPRMQRIRQALDAPEMVEIRRSADGQDVRAYQLVKHGNAPLGSPTAAAVTIESTFARQRSGIPAATCGW